MTEAFFDLQTPQDVLRKLRHDFGRLKESPVDSYAAFDFFVTAYHMLEWRYRDRNKPEERTQTYEKKENWFLPVCRQLANGAKHFQAGGGAVKDTMRTLIPSGSLAPGSRSRPFPRFAAAVH